MSSVQTVTYVSGMDRFDMLPEDDVYQTFLEDEFDFDIRSAARGEKRLILQEPPIFCKEYA